MSTPYERMLRPAQPKKPTRPPLPPQEVQPAARPAAENATILTSAQAGAKKNLVVKKRAKPTLPFFVRPRFRFDLPDPPMDPKMLLGRLSTASYARPFLFELESEVRPVAIPADPSHALRANLITPAVQRPSSRAHKLSLDDDALLQSVMNVRPGASKTLNADGSNLRSAGPSGVSGGGVAKPKTQANNVSNAPWMRRMSYDEYFARSGTARLSSASKQPRKSTVQQDKELLHDPKVKERRRKQLLSTFAMSRKPPVHPDLRKGHLKPVHIAPVFPDFASLGHDFIAVHFDLDTNLTLENRAKVDEPATEESIRSMATISLAEPTTSQMRNEKPKKFVACYTPTDDTLENRKRKREDIMGSEDEIEVKVEDEIGQKANRKAKKQKKISFAEEESYLWFGEYAIREGKFGAENGRGPVMSRSCFSVREHLDKNDKKRVACFKRVSTSWKLVRRPAHEASRLGKEGLKLARDTSNDIDDGSDSAKILLLSGKGRNTAALNGAKKEKAMVEILEED